MFAKKTIPKTKFSHSQAPAWECILQFTPPKQELGKQGGKYHRYLWDCFASLAMTLLFKIYSAVLGA